MPRHSFRLAFCSERQNIHCILAHHTSLFLPGKRCQRHGTPQTTRRTQCVRSLIVSALRAVSLTWLNRNRNGSASPRVTRIHLCHPHRGIRFARRFRTGLDLWQCHGTSGKSQRDTEPGYWPSVLRQTMGRRNTANPALFWQSGPRSQRSVAIKP